jgi:terminase small subunit-like protein
MPRKPSPKLAIVADHPGATLPQPPLKLGAAGMSLWRDVLAAYEFSDRGSYETLAQACSAADRAAEMAAQIDQDGVVLRTKTGLRDHPLLKHELAARAFVVRSLARLGLDLEPVRPGPGRPGGGGVGISWKALPNGDET